MHTSFSTFSLEVEGLEVPTLWLRDTFMPYITWCTPQTIPTGMRFAAKRFEAHPTAEQWQDMFHDVWCFVETQLHEFVRVRDDPSPTFKFLPVEEWGKAQPADRYPLTGIKSPRGINMALVELHLMPILWTGDRKDGMLVGLLFRDKPD
jgi:hypothetical protein